MNDCGRKEPASVGNATEVPLTIDAEESTMQDAIGDVASNEEMSAEEDDGTALAKLRHLIRTRTRFDAGDVQGASETVAAQPLVVSVAHSLTAELKAGHINGYTVPQGSTPCRNARTEAMDGRSERMALAVEHLNNKLRDPQSSYDAIDDGMWLPQADTYYHLDSCSPCAGNGRVTCHACGGDCQETCSSCRGAGKTQCYKCSGSGKLTCLHCYGRMCIDVTVVERITVSVWVNDHFETRYDSRTVPKTEPCHQCTYGKVNCNNCSYGQVDCNTCGTRGKITCRTCSGVGNLSCDSCEGSGQVGQMAWVEVHHKATYTLAWGSPRDPRAAEIEAKVGLHRVAQESRSMTLTGVDHTDSALGLVRVGYAGTLDIMHLDALCNREHYHVVAFGINRQWHDLNGVIGDLLSGDLEALRSTLMASGKSRLFGMSINDLAIPLRQVTDSELNIALVDATLNGEPVDELHTILSDEYSKNLKLALLSALKRIYTRIGLRTCWPVPLVSGLAAGVLWWFSYPLLGVLAVLVSLLASLGYLQTRAKVVIGGVLGDKSKAIQAIGLIKKARHHYWAYTPHYLLWLFVTGLAVFGVVRPHSMATATKALTRVATSSTPEVPLASDVSLVHAIDLVAQHQFARARPLLEALAAKGETKAYLPLAKVLMFDDQGDMQNTGQIDRPAAAAWALKAAKAFPDDAEALFVAGELAVSEWNKSSNMTTGIPLLERAAAKGSTDAMHALGLIYIHGANVPKSVTKARHWFTQSADAGQAVDMYNVGLMDWFGEGLKSPNRTSAREWWHEAAALGEERARKALAEGRPPGA